MDSFFSHPIFLSLFLFKNRQFPLRMVSSWIPTFLVPFSFCFLSKSSKNELWVERCGGRARVHDKFMLNSKHPSNIQSFHGSRVLEDILSIVLRSCPSTALGRKNFGWSILGSYFSILFSSPFPFTSFLFENLQD